MDRQAPIHFVLHKDLKRGVELKATAEQEKRLIIVFSADRRLFAITKNVKFRMIAKRQEETLLTSTKEKWIGKLLSVLLCIKT